MIDDPNTPDSGSGLDVGLNRPVKFKNGIKKKQYNWKIPWYNTLNYFIFPIVYWIYLAFTYLRKY